MAADAVCHGVSAAVEGHQLDLQAQSVAHTVGSHTGGVAETGASHRDLAGVRLAIVDKLIHVGDAQILIDAQIQGADLVANDGRKVLKYVIVRAVRNRANDERGTIGAEQRIAVVIAVQDLKNAGNRVAASDILYDDLSAQELFESGGHQTSVDIHAAAGRERANKRNLFLRILELRRGGLGRLGCGRSGRVVSAATNETAEQQS